MERRITDFATVYVIQGFEQTLGNSERGGSPWGCRELDMTLVICIYFLVIFLLHDTHHCYTALEVIHINTVRILDIVFNMNNPAISELDIV